MPTSSGAGRSTPKGSSRPQTVAVTGRDDRLRASAPTRTARHGLRGDGAGRAQVRTRAFAMDASGGLTEVRGRRGGRRVLRLRRRRQPQRGHPRALAGRASRDLRAGRPPGREPGGDVHLRRERAAGRTHGRQRNDDLHHTPDGQLLAGAPAGRDGRLLPLRRLGRSRSGAWTGS